MLSKGFDLCICGNQVAMLTIWSKGEMSDAEGIDINSTRWRKGKKAITLDSIDKCCGILAASIIVTT